MTHPGYRTIEIEGIVYEVETYDDILLHAPDHTLVLNGGWWLLQQTQNRPLERLFEYIEMNYRSANKITE